MHANKLRLAAAACAAALALAAPAAAQTGTAPAPAPADTSAPIPAARLQAAADMIEAQQLRENYEPIIDAALDAQLANAPGLNQFRDLMRDFFHRYMGWDQVKDEFIHDYAERFSEDELRQMAAFFRTPAGQHLLREQPELMRRGSELAQRHLQAHMGELQQAIRQRMAAARPSAGTYESGSGKKPVRP